MQKFSQQLILYITPRLSQICQSYLRASFQPYVESQFPLNLEIYAKPLKEIFESVPKGRVVKVSKLSYGLAEFGAF